MSAPELSTEILDTCIDELEYLTCHYVHHFADAMRIVALYHPELSVRQQALWIHNEIAEEIFHFKTESDAMFQWRHRDKRVAGSDTTASPTR